MAQASLLEERATCADANSRTYLDPDPDPDSDPDSYVYTYTYSNILTPIYSSPHLQ